MSVSAPSSTSSSPGPPPLPARVFVSYMSETVEESRRVMELVDRLQGDGLLCALDREPDSPGARAELERQIDTAGFVLMVWDAKYRWKYEQGSAVGSFTLGRGREIAMIANRLANRSDVSVPFIPVIFSKEDARFIPEEIKERRVYDLTDFKEYEELMALLNPNWRRKEEEEEAAESETKAEGNALEEFNTAEFTEGAWVVLLVAMKLAALRNDSRCAERDLMAALLLWGMVDSRAQHTGRWLGDQILEDDARVLEGLAQDYPAIRKFSERHFFHVHEDFEAVADMTRGLKVTLHFARDLAKTGAPDSPRLFIAARHFCAALVRAQHHDTDVESLLQRFKLSAETVRSRLLHDLPKWPVSDDAAVWRRLLGDRDSGAAPPAASSHAPVALPDGLPAYASDSTNGPDLIGITREVEAMASLVSAWSVEPPLSIGLFGEWGSGKSFFMQKMRERVRQIAAAARKSGQGQKEFGYYKNIVQVEFNAWHYVEGNLWASLVEHIFGNLRLEGTGDEDTDSEANLTRRLERVFEVIKEKSGEMLQKEAEAARVREVAESKKKSAEERATKLEEEARAARVRENDALVAKGLAEQRAMEEQRRADEKLQERRSLGAKAWIQELTGSEQIREQAKADLAVLGIKGEQLDTVRGLRTALREATEGATAVGAGIKLIVEDRNPWRLLLWLAAGPAVLAGLVWFHAWLTEQDPDPMAWMKSINSLASVAAAALAGIVGVWRRYVPRLKPVLQAMENVKQRRAKLERKIDEARQERVKEAAAMDAEVVKLQQEAARHQKDAEQKAAEAESARTAAREAQEAALRATESAEAARTEVQKLTRDAEELQPERRIASFIQDRAKATDYRQHLGVAAIIRRDFEKLSAMFQTQRAVESRAGDSRDGSSNDLAVVNRIILYIDDLDRCPPERVVEVLRAIHLLLAFPLFIVVVAVDARWVKRSLRDRFSLLLASEQEEDKKDAPAPQQAAAVEHHAADRDEFDHMATPEDYLEKIFQVPFWIRPLGSTSRENLLRALTSDVLSDEEPPSRDVPAPPALAPASVDSTIPPAPAEVSPSPVAEASPTQITADTSSSPPQPPPAEKPPATDAAASDASPPDSAPPKPCHFHWSDVEPRPRALHLTAEERDFMLELAPLIARSPRSVKRFVNCYRLLKSALDKDQLAKVTHDGTFRPTMFLLALMTGLPRLAPDLMKQLRRMNRHASFKSWVSEVGDTIEHNHHEGAAHVVPLLKKLQQSAHLQTIAPLADAVELVDRFSFSPVRSPTSPSAGR